MNSQSIVEECVKAVHRSRGFAVLATERDGQPHASFIAITPVEGFRHLIFATYRTTRKYRNLAGNGKVAVLIDGRTTTEAGVQDGFVLTALGRAEEVNAEEHEAAMCAHLARHPDLESFLRSADCVLVRVTVSAYQVVRAIDDVTWWHIDDHLAFSPRI